MRSMVLRKVFVCGLGLTLAAAAAACGGGSEPANAPASSSAPASAPAAAGNKVDSATAGELKGMVSLEGTAPKNEPIRMNADPVCVKQTSGSPQTQETYVVGSDGK